MKNQNFNHPTDLVKIGVFIDGQWFLSVSRYYYFGHPRQSYISIGGLHELIRHQVARETNNSFRLCQVVDSHFFSGRFTAAEARDRDDLYSDRVLDDQLMFEGVVTHYLPMKKRENRINEKGIDVWFALEAFELSVYKRFDVVVLITGDGDYVPLARKINTLGTKVMLLYWDLSYTDSNGMRRDHITSRDLVREVNYAIDIPALIDSKASENDPILRSQIDALFYKPAKAPPPPREPGAPAAYDNRGSSPVYNQEDGNPMEFVAQVKKILDNGCGFIENVTGIENEGRDVFFHYTSFTPREEFNELQSGDYVVFSDIVRNPEGRLQARQVYREYTNAQPEHQHDPEHEHQV